MRCNDCQNGDLLEELRHKSAVSNGRVAVVTDVPVTVCPSCGMVWYSEDVAVELDRTLGDPENLQAMSDAARDRYRSGLTWYQIGEQYRLLLNRYLPGNRKNSNKN